MNYVFVDLQGFPGYQICKEGIIKSHKGTLLKNCFDSHNHCIHRLRNENGKLVSVYLSHLMAKTFLENPENKPEVDHKDNDPKNNHIDNLRWATRSENTMNRKKPKNNTSGFKGVIKQKNIFVARCAGWYVGSYKTAEEAKQAYDNYAQNYAKTFYNPN